MTDLHRLITARERIRASQEDVGQALGVSRSWVTELERGATPLTASRARRYAEALAAIQDQRTRDLREILENSLAYSATSGGNRRDNALS